MSLYADYHKELWGLSSIEFTNAFATYVIDGQECHLQDLYVSPEDRRQGICFKLADAVAEIARLAGCKYLTCLTKTSIPHWEVRQTVFHKYGFTSHKVEDDRLYFIKELK